MVSKHAIASKCVNMCTQRLGCWAKSYKSKWERKQSSTTIDRKTSAVNALVNTTGYFKDHTGKWCEDIVYIFVLKLLILKSTKNIFIGHLHVYWFKRKNL